jgi:regulator of cell morphogenesis and NO signaling
MLQLTIDDPVVDWAIEHAESIPVFEKHGIDYCCGGKSLAWDCKHRGLDPHLILAEIKQAIFSSDASVGPPSHARNT